MPITHELSLKLVVLASENDKKWFEISGQNVIHKEVSLL